ncbi:MAG: DEAD/DEAH box helicase family protein [Candidatus Methylumidiphilus sp.]
MAAEKRSGHCRLKQALILRDALAAELGLDWAKAMAPLYNVEDNAGAARALDEGRYLDALAALCLNDKSRLAHLHGLVHAACGRVKLAPRYAQYLALLLFAHWHEAQQDDSAAFLARLNAWLAAHPPPHEKLEPFSAEDLQMAAFWMATAAGKTHVLHACLALLDGGDWERVFIVTPSESLTRQHADKLRELGEWAVFAYPFDGDRTALGRLPPEAVIIIDINKLADTQKGDGLAIPTSVFQEGRNLVFVDEGHKGQKSEASVWKKLQQDLAGLGAPAPRRRGLLVEFSATFGQVAEAEHAFSRYAKSIVFDYAYDRFHADLYGKDFWHAKLDGRGEAGPAAYRQTLTAALLAYWHQLATFQCSASR